MSIMAWAKEPNVYVGYNLEVPMSRSLGTHRYEINYLQGGSQVNKLGNETITTAITTCDYCKLGIIISIIQVVAHTIVSQKV
jgi:hypothetical protein